MTMMEGIEKLRVSDDALDQVFRKARTYNSWLPKPVPDELLRQLYDTLKWGPTSANMSPARFLFIRSKAAKERLRPSLAPGNVEKTMAAPVNILVGFIENDVFGEYLVDGRAATHRIVFTEDVIKIAV